VSERSQEAVAGSRIERGQARGAQTPSQVLPRLGRARSVVPPTGVRLDSLCDDAGDGQGEGGEQGQGCDNSD